MKLEHISLARQLDMAFRALDEELSYISSGTVFVHIRNNTIGKFGIKHNPIDSLTEYLPKEGLTPVQRRDFRQMAIQALKFKNGWTHGEIHFDFVIRKNTLIMNVMFESNYNMANLVSTGACGKVPMVNE